MHWAATLLARRVGKKRGEGALHKPLCRAPQWAHRPFRLWRELQDCGWKVLGVTQSRLRQGDSSCGGDKSIFNAVCGNGGWHVHHQCRHLLAAVCTLRVAKRKKQIPAPVGKTYADTCLVPSAGWDCFNDVFFFRLNIPPLLPFPMQPRCRRTLSAPAETLAASSNNWFCNECGRPFKMERGKWKKIYKMALNISKVL